jgi:hypothetical protein
LIVSACNGVLLDDDAEAQRSSFTNPNEPLPIETSEARIQQMHQDFWRGSETYRQAYTTAHQHYGKVAARFNDVHTLMRSNLIDASAQMEKGEVYLDHTLNELWRSGKRDRAYGLFAFEVKNLSRAKDYAALNQHILSGQVEMIANQFGVTPDYVYARRMEQFEYENLFTQHQMIQEMGVKVGRGADVWGAKIQGEWRTFEGYLAKVEQNGHMSNYRRGYYIKLQLGARMGKEAQTLVAAPIEAALSSSGTVQGKLQAVQQVLESQPLYGKIENLASHLLEEVRPYLKQLKPLLTAAAFAADVALLASAIREDIKNGDAKMHATEKMVAQLLGSHAGMVLGAMIGNCILPGVGGFIGGFLGGLAGWTMGKSLAEWIMGRSPSTFRATQNVFIFVNLKGGYYFPKVERGWTGCMFREGQEVKERECGEVEQKSEAKWDIFPAPENADYKVIKPAGDVSLCLTAPKIRCCDVRGQNFRVSLQPCTTQAGETEYQKWNWWVDSPDDEAWAQNLGADRDWPRYGCLDASYTDDSVLVHTCKGEQSRSSPGTMNWVDYQNQMWQWGTTWNYD